MTGDDQSRKPPPPAFAGTPRFHPRAYLGQGSMGAVYRVIDDELGCAVALKTLHELSAEQVYRLKSEFRSIAGIVHPNLVQLHDLVVTDATCFFTMQLVEGVDFVEHVRGDEPRGGIAALLQRFVSAAPQLVRGVGALHAANRLHRDIKPSNIRVTPEGHVVVLDFDLATPLIGSQDAASLASASAGTFAYMAPEQVGGGALTPAADLYAIGVVFYEALTGQLPFDGSAAEIFFLKQSGRPASPRHWVSGLPRELERLVGSLLAVEPGERPSATDVLAALQPLRAPDVVSDADGAVDPAPRREAFVGRATELEALRELCLPLPRATVTVACVHGVSGIGKTVLLTQLVRELEGRGGALVLRGRCHPQESVPYKALDPLIDGLSRHLLGLPASAAAALRPRYASALVRLFPVLARVPAFAQTRGPADEIDTHEVRRRGVVAFRELLTRVARACPLVLWIDDLQWGDLDSTALIVELLRPPDAPPLILLLSYRSEEAAQVALLPAIAQMATDADGPRQAELELRPLDSVAATALAETLCPPAQRSTDTVAALVAQSGGSPFLLAALSWSLAEREPAAGGALAVPDLGRVLGARVARLPEIERRIIELIAVAGGPIERSAVLQAAAQGEAGRPLIARLAGQGWLRTTHIDDRAAVETYHDRIRESVVAALDDADRARRHGDLAMALEASGHTEPERLAEHFHGAGVLAKAADYAVAAADKAADSVAFARAAELYRQAREWDARDGAWQRRLLEREGDALANAASFSDAAQALLAAAGGAASGDALELRRRAAEHLLAAGRFDDGVETLFGVLDQLGLRYPRSQNAAMLGAAWHVGRLLLRQPAPRADFDAIEVQRAEACYSAGKALVDIDPPRGVYFSLAALRHAWRAGEPVRLGCALAVVGGSLRVVGGAPLTRLAARLVAQAEAIAEATGSPLVRGTIDVGIGQVLMLEGRWREAIARCDAGVRVLSERCRGAAFECNLGRGIPLRAIEELGDLTQVEQRALELLQAGALLHDRRADAMGSPHMSTVLLGRDDVAGARVYPRRTWAAWTRESFHLQHFYLIRQEAMCDLYAGDAAPSYARVREAWPAIQRAQLLRVPLSRVDALSIRGRLALALGAATGDPELLRAAARDAGQLARERRDDATVHAALLSAGVAATSGDRGMAARELASALAAAERAEMRLYAAVARYREGELLGGDEGAERRRAAADVMARCGVRVAGRWAATYAPGAW